MFGFAKRARVRQLKRAIIIQNIIMMNIFSHQRKAAGGEGAKSDKFDRVIASSINQLFGQEIDAAEFSQEDKRLFSKVTESVKSDLDLDKLILRVLFDIFTLSCTLKNVDLISKYSGATDILERGKKIHPDIFEDWKEIQFKALLERYADKCDPSLKDSLRKMFS